MPAVNNISFLVTIFRERPIRAALESIGPLKSGRHITGVCSRTYSLMVIDCFVYTSFP